MHHWGHPEPHGHRGRLARRLPNDTQSKFRSRPAHQGFGVGNRDRALSRPSDDVGCCPSYLSTTLKRATLVSAGDHGFREGFPTLAPPCRWLRSRQSQHQKPFKDADVPKRPDDRNHRNPAAGRPGAPAPLRARLSRLMEHTRGTALEERLHSNFAAQCLVGRYDRHQSTASRPLRRTRSRNASRSIGVQVRPAIHCNETRISYPILPKS